MISNALKFAPKRETRGRKRALSPRCERMLISKSKREPFKPATELKKDLNITACVETVRSRLREHNLNACSPRKVPSLTSAHIKKRLEFAKNHVDWPTEKWRNILWTDESKIVLFGSKGSRSYVRRPPNTEYNPMFTAKTIKHGGCSIMIWGCFSYHGVGPIHWIRTIMDQHVYVEIMNNVMLPYVEDEMPLLWVFQQDNDPKHTSKTAKKWFQDHEVKVMEWPAQSPDLNPIEHLWADVKKEVSNTKPNNISELWNVVQCAWNKISKERCQKLVDSMPRRCAAVIQNGGHATKY